MNEAMKKEEVSLLDKKGQRVFSLVAAILFCTLAVYHMVWWIVNMVLGGEETGFMGVMYHFIQDLPLVAFCVLAAVVCFIGKNKLLLLITTGVGFLIPVFYSFVGWTESYYTGGYYGKTVYYTEVYSVGLTLEDAIQFLGMGLLIVFVLILLRPTKLFEKNGKYAVAVPAALLLVRELLSAGVWFFNQMARLFAHDSLMSWGDFFLDVAYNLVDLTFIAAVFLFCAWLVSVEKPKPKPAPRAVAPEEEINTVEEIRKYKELLDMGAITQEEFEQKKRQFLNL